MLTSKQRSYLRGLASKEQPVILIGKKEIEPSLINQAKDALVARELIKGKVQQNAMMDAGEAAELLAKALKADIVNVMGSTFVLFKRNPQNIKINIPTKKIRIQKHNACVSNARKNYRKNYHGKNRYYGRQFQSHSSGTFTFG